MADESERTERTDTTQWLRDLLADADDGAPTSLRAEALVEALHRRRRRSRLGLGLGLAGVATIAAALTLTQWRPTSAERRSGLRDHFAAAAAMRAASAREAENHKPPIPAAHPPSQPSRQHLTTAAPTAAPTPAPQLPAPQLPAPQLPAPQLPIPPEELEPSPPSPAPERPAPPRTAADLFEEARAARVARDVARARAALTSIRVRFPGSADAGQATFMLGRVALELAGDADDARAWFERYAEEFPDGPLAAQARGRVLRRYVALGEDDRARAAAREYLSAHPDGPDAELARELQGERP